MTPFQSVRLWMRRAPVGERALVAVAAALAAAVLVWQAAQPGIVRPTRPSFAASSGSPAPRELIGGTAASKVPVSPMAANAAGAVTVDGRGSARPAPVAEAANSSTPAGSALPGPVAARDPLPGTCTSPPGADQGISTSSINLAVVIIDLSGAAANSAFGLPSSTDQESDFQAVANSINAGGGVACRHLSLSYFHVNPADQTSAQSACVSMVNNRPFLVVDSGAYSQSPFGTCFAQNGLPLLTTQVTYDLAEQRYPLFFGLENPDLEDRNAVFALSRMGFYAAGSGFTKLGFIYRSCYPDSISLIRDALRSVGVPDARIDLVDVGCSNNFTSPSVLEQAILRFQSDHVSSVTEAFLCPDMPNFTRIAEQQGFKPKYGFSDDCLVSSAGGALAPDANNFDGAIDVAGARYGESNTPGYVPSPGTQRCNGIFATPVYQQASGFGGRACTELWLASAAIAHAPSLQRRSLAAGLQAAGHVELSFPEGGPNDFSQTGVTWGDSYWRPLQYSSSCSCFRVLDATFAPSFP